MDTVRVRWDGDLRFAARDASGREVVMDTSAANGGGAGPRPVEMVLYALAGCTGMDVVSILRKKRQAVTGVEIVVTGTPREDDYPHYYEVVEVEYVVSGRGVEPAAVERAIELSEGKYCSVRGMFGPHVSVRTSYRIVEAGEDAEA